MNEQREAIAETIHTAVEVAGIPDPYWLASTRELYERRVQADAVIAHLWQRADDPAVVEAVAAVTARSPAFVKLVKHYLMTELLGPRPAEQEADR